MAYGSVKIDSITTSTKTVAIDNLSVNGYINNASIAIDAAIAFSKLQNVSAADKILGRGSSGAGAIEEITCTAAGRALLDDADAAAQRTTLGLGTLATQSGTFSGTSSGTNTGDQTIQLTGDVTGSGTGTFAATIANDAVTYAKIQNVSATDKLLGRSTAGSGDVEEITCTAAGRALLDDVDAAAQRTTLGLGSLAVSSNINTGLTDPVITGCILEDVYTIVDGAAFEVDPGNGSVQLITLGASRTPKATNFVAGESVTLMIDDGSGYTLTWSDTTWGTGGVTWVGGSAPTLATTGYTVIQFWKVGTKVYGFRVGDVA